MQSQPTKLQGILTDVFPIETTANFTKRVFWLKEPGTERYPQHWELELHGEDVSRTNKVKIGDRLECDVEVRGRKWKSRDGKEKIYTSLKCIGMKLLEKIEVTESYKSKGHDKDVDNKPQPELPL